MEDENQSIDRIKISIEMPKPTNETNVSYDHNSLENKDRPAKLSEFLGAGYSDQTNQTHANND